MLNPFVILERSEEMRFYSYQLVKISLDLLPWVLFNWVILTREYVTSMIRVQWLNGVFI